MLKFFLFATALASLAPALACQKRVVLLKFDANGLSGVDRLDSLFVLGIDPMKPDHEVTDWRKTLGYFDVSKNSISVRVKACAGMQLLGFHTDSYLVMGDVVTIPVDGKIDQGAPTSCEMAGTGGASGGTGGDGIGGAFGGGGGADGSAAGGAGGSATGGGGIGGAGVGGESGANGGASDAGDCGTDTHAPVCEPPSDDAGAGDTHDPPMYTAECDQYCNDIQTKCAGVAGLYDSLESCRRYCVEAGWASTDPQLRNNSLSCRNMYLTQATPTAYNLPSLCAYAGPTGNFSCGMPCPNFCAAWVGICGRNAAEASACLTACQALNISSGGTDPTCRFQLIQRALFDTRYCDFVGYTTGSCLRCD